jgi:uncharacterized protein YdhG (YjbR/CyaY superfamily)/GNAT superfamily N-acetyltransferase
MNDIDKYIAGFPDDIQSILKQVRTTIRKAAPQAVEAIKYGMPTYILNGNLVHFAAFKQHIGLYPAPEGNDSFKKEISVYKGAKSSIRFPLDKPIPLDLISRIVEFRIMETMGRKSPKNRQEPEIMERLTIEPLTKRNWNKFVKLFGDRGACGNCWCMYYRLSNADFKEGKAEEGNKRAIKEIVWAGKPAGLLGLLEGEAIAWCALAPREDFIRLENSRVHKRIDDKAVWSMPCFFVDKDFRKSGLSVQLLKGAIRYAKENGIKILEAYPTIPTQGKLPDSFAWVGLYKSFERAGFEIVDKTSRNRPMVRYYTDKNILTFIHDLE